MKNELTDDRNIATRIVNGTGKTFIRTNMTRKLLILALLFVASSASRATDASLNLRVESKRSELRTITTPELPAWAVQEIAKTGVKERNSEVAVVLRAVVFKAPSAVPSVVGRISQEFASISPFIASEAAGLLPRQAFEISRAAVSAAPKYASEIAVAVAKVVPSSATAVARASAISSPEFVEQMVSQVSETVPSSSKAIESDPVISRIRVTRSAAGNQTPTGNVSSGTGTIRGTIPDEDPEEIDSSRVSPGSDPDRGNYGRPT
jgi:hypothetical protein